MLIGVAGVGAHEHDGSCPLTKLPRCCKTARSSKNAPGASIARVCCNLNCSEPGSTGNASSSSFARQQGAAANTPVAVGAAAQFDFRVVLSRQLQQFHLADSNPRYIKHLALLI
jgi:hypothetical protein